MKLELDLSNYVTKADLKNATGVDTSQFAKKVDLANIKSEVYRLEKVPIGLNSLKKKVDKLDVDQLVPVSADLSKLNDVVKQTLKVKVNAVKTADTSNLVKKLILPQKLVKLKKIKIKILVMIIVISIL